MAGKEEEEETEEEEVENEFVSHDTASQRFINGIGVKGGLDKVVE